MDDIARREHHAAWELRAAWAGRWIVVVTLDTGQANVPRLSGRVERVSPTGAKVTLEAPDGGHVDIPCRVILTVRRPHFHEPADREATHMERLPPRNLEPLDGQLELFNDGQDPCTCLPHEVT